MNFKNMPEPEYRSAYPTVIAISIIKVIISLIFFKKKNGYKTKRDTVRILRKVKRLIEEYTL